MIETRLFEGYITSITFWPHSGNMRFSSRLIPGTLIRRYKRFLADVRLRNGQVYLSRRDRQGGRLTYAWEMIQVGWIWVAIITLNPKTGWCSKATPR